MSKFSITFQRKDGSRFETEYFGENADHATSGAAIALEKSLGETEMEVVEVFAVFYTNTI